MVSTTTYTKAPSCTGAFAARGLRAADSAAHMAVATAGTAAPIGGTGLPVGVEPRLRPAGSPMTEQLNSTTPGDQPPRDPLS